MALIALAALLRFATLDAKSLWEDEAATAFLVRMDIPSMLAAISHGENTPPLFFLLSFAWTKVFGTGEVGMRSLSALAGLGVVPVAYLAGRELVSRRTGLVTAALVAVNPLLVWYSQEARSYSLLVLTSTVTLLFFGRVLNDPRPRELAIWAAAASVSLATHYFAAFVVIPETLWLLHVLGRRRVVLATVAAITVVGAALVPLALAQAAHHGGWIGHIGLVSRVIQIPGIFLVGFESPMPLLVVGVGAAIAAYGIWLLLRHADKPARKRALLAAGIGGAGILLPLGLSLVGIDYLLYKNVIGSLVPLTIAVAAGFAASRAGRRGVVAALAVCLLSVAIVVATAWVPKYHREAWREAAQALAPPTGARAVVATPGSAGREPLEYYLSGSRTLRSGSVWLSEIDVLALRRRPLGAMATPQLPRLSGPTRLPVPGYRLIERRNSEYFRLLRYRAARPQHLEIGQLKSAAIDTVEPVVLVQS